ncbi:MAG: xanthine dehydrogenase accessory protein XdhC [Devosiaceae bacterium]|nr:xanthine dehydrogenase accessory protein XdhC [Devosiaceae bacterium MH13]
MLDAPSPSDVERFAQRAPAICVTVTQARGSTPRVAGTRMLVSETDALGTIGGGQLEFMAIDAAREMLAAGRDISQIDVPLGPAIGQCCGGHVSLDLQRATAQLVARLVADAQAEHAAQPHVLIFGAGHVGRALATALLPLPVSAVLIDSRTEELSLAQDQVQTRCTPLPEAEVRRAPPGSCVVILTHDHATDFLIAREALARADCAYVGMIGSKTKRATFARWLEDETGSRDLLAGLTMPIGASISRDKRPAVVAAFVAAELMERVAAWQGARHHQGATA